MWGGTRVLIEVALFTRNKRQDFFISLIHEMRKAGRDVVGIICGAPNSEDDMKFKSECEQQVCSLGIQNSVFLAGYRTNIPDFLDLADIVVVPSQEGLPLAALEAMAAQKCVVACNSGGAGELLKKAQSGVLYDEKSSVEKIAKDVIKDYEGLSYESIQNGYEFCKEQTEEKYRSNISNMF